MVDVKASWEEKRSYCCQELRVWMTKCVAMENDKEMHETFLQMSKMVDIMYESYEKWREEDTKRSESDASSTYFGAYAFYSSPSLNEEINQRLQEKNAK